MDTAYTSALFGFAGVVVGGLASLSTTWITQQSRRREAERMRCVTVFDAVIAEATRLYADARRHQKDEVSDLVPLYALVARMRLIASRPVVTAAKRAMDVIIDSYLAPNRTLHEFGVSPGMAG